MSRFSIYWPAAWLALAGVLAIVYGSLYPFEFRPPAVDDPWAALWATRQFVFEHTGNVIGNVLFYLPFGLFGGLAFGRPTWRRALLLIAFSVFLSVSMEWTQFHVAGRVSTCRDIYPNVAGAAIGACLAFVVSGAGRRMRVPLLSADPAALFLLALFFAYRLFPYVPSLDLVQYWHAVQSLFAIASLRLDDVAGYGVRWLVVAELISCSIGVTYGISATIFVIGGVFAAKIAIVHNALSPAEPIGALAALIVARAIRAAGPRLRAAVLCAALLVLVVGMRLQPFAWLAHARAFGWVPFASLLHGSMVVNALSMLEKCFLYGTLVWLLQRAGLRWLFAGGLVTLILLTTSVTETRLPGRSAEITDAILALLMTAVLFSIRGLVSMRGPAGVRAIAPRN